MTCATYCLPPLLAPSLPCSLPPSSLPLSFPFLSPFPSFLAIFSLHSHLLLFSYNMVSTNFSTDGKSSGTSIDPSNHLTYFNGQINMTYGKSPSPSVNFIFECDQETSGLQTGPTCEKKSEKLYECFWPTAFACRPMINVQCSIRNEDGSVDDQYDYSPLSESARNWQAQITGQNLDGVSYFINVCRTVLLKGGAKHCPPTAGVCMVDKGYVYMICPYLSCSGPIGPVLSLQILFSYFRFYIFCACA